MPSRAAGPEQAPSKHHPAGRANGWGEAGAGRNQGRVNQVHPGSGTAAGFGGHRPIPQNLARPVTSLWKGGTPALGTTAVQCPTSCLTDFRSSNNSSYDDATLRLFSSGSFPRKSHASLLPERSGPIRHRATNARETGCRASSEQAGRVAAPEARGGRGVPTAPEPPLAALPPGPPFLPPVPRSVAGPPSPGTPPRPGTPRGSTAPPSLLQEPRPPESGPPPPSPEGTLLGGSGPPPLSGQKEKRRGWGLR